jgi:hypothetical protein
MRSDIWGCVKKKKNKGYGKEKTINKSIVVYCCIYNMSLRNPP